MIWRAREVPLAVGAAVARRDAARRCAARLLALPDDTLALLRGAAMPGLLVVAGSDLPWIDGIEYLGKDDSLFLPTTVAPGVPLPLLARAIAASHPGLTPPIAVVGNPDLIISLAALAPIARQVLEQWR